MVSGRAKVLEKQSKTVDGDNVGLDLVDTLQSQHRSQLDQMRKTSAELDPQDSRSCAEFSQIVHGVQSGIIHSYKLIAFAAVRNKDPRAAADLWKVMLELCDAAVEALCEAKQKFPQCGTHEVCNMTLDYRFAAKRRFDQNLADAECPPTPLPPNLFPKET